jgi:RHS repeat-associated protein
VGEAGLFAKGVRNGVGYCGYIFNDESGLYTVRYRSYSPTLGRWLERDPAGYVDGMGLYEYVRGGPITAVDPSGQVAVNPVIVAAAAVVAATAACYLLHEEEAWGFVGAGDKFRHCWLSCKMSRTCGGLLTRIAGLGKEIRDQAFALYCSQRPNSPWCQGGHGDLEDSFMDLIANEQCIGWESNLGLGPAWLGALCRQSCEDCCRSKVPYSNYPTEP